MARAGLRYKNLASRCRQSAAASDKSPEKAALIRMAEAYERRAEELEAEWQRAVESAKQPYLPLPA